MQDRNLKTTSRLQNLKLKKNYYGKRFKYKSFGLKLVNNWFCLLHTSYFFYVNFGVPARPSATGCVC